MPKQDHEDLKSVPMDYPVELPPADPKPAPPKELDEEDKLRINLLGVQRENIELKIALCRQELAMLEKMSGGLQKQHADLRTALAAKYRIDWTKTRLDESGRFVPTQ